MTLEELKEELVESSKEDWERFEELGEFTYKKNLEVRIHSIEESKKEETIDWLRFPDKSAYYCKYLVCYNNSIVEEVELIDVDGCRATIPYYKPNSRVSKLSEKVAQIVDSQNDTETYMKRAKNQLMNN